MLLGNCEPEACTTFCLGIGAIYLMKLLEDPRYLLRHGDPWSGVGDTDLKGTIPRRRADPHLTVVGEFDGIADEVEQDLGEALLITNAHW